jgi:hypothetical protein
MKNTKISSIILIPILLFCLLPMPYGYYHLLRVISTIIFSYIAYQERRSQIMWISIGLAILFQPFEKIIFGRLMWNMIDVMASLFLAWYSYFKKEIKS